MKKRFVFLLSAMLATAATKAETYPYLTFQSADGTMQSVEVESLTMTFSDGKLLVSNGTKSLELAVADLSSMFFSTSDATGIETVSAAEADGNMAVFSLQGTSVGSFSSVQQLRTSVPAGVYIIKKGGKTQKITVK